ncbi:hypothetical protein CLOSTASPAR_01487 [[Clostridium] asparagiforme DSM 15981]|uniref:Uncharacterized protein n=1 Tax=[Clostridium] asparagiforme DSM 15981 TaxID=518636 RepID=C0CWW6_9FIRM|nr:hypothetical protein CLOSTASPAR_01487 [[Clostridium] asparagiforme DSM 15981]
MVSTWSGASRSAKASWIEIPGARTPERRRTGRGLRRPRGLKSPGARRVVGGSGSRSAKASWIEIIMRGAAKLCCMVEVCEGLVD